MDFLLDASITHLDMNKSIWLPAKKSKRAGNRAKQSNLNGLNIFGSMGDSNEYTQHTFSW